MSIFQKILGKQTNQLDRMLVSVCLLAALFPPAMVLLGLDLDGIAFAILLLMNVSAWGVVILLVRMRAKIRATVNHVGQIMGVTAQERSTEALVNSVLAEVVRKNQSLSIDLIERRIDSEKALSEALQAIVALAYRLLGAESAELALFDEESSGYHSSFVLGKPFLTSAQATFSGAIDGEENQISPNVLVQPIAFAGSVLGSLRVALKRGAVPGSSDREIIRILALQGGLAILNSEYTSELMRMKSASEETVRAKTGFLANLSHEIRGPLGIMLNAVELVLDGLCGKINEDQDETLRMVKSNGQHLLELINDVLDYAKMESGKVVPKEEALLVSEILTDVTNVVRAQADAKGHTIRCENSDDVFAIQCDRRHFRQMLINLLTNAIKYTPDGGEIIVYAERALGGRVQINVQDSGVGIEEKDREKVFSAFERIEHSYSLGQVGTGLGMPLTKRLVEVNGGQIDFTSTPAKGSTFWLSFPLIPYEASDHVASGDNLPEAKGQGERILLYGKESPENVMMTRYLEHIGFAIEYAAQVDAVQEKLTSQKIELLLIEDLAPEALHHKTLIQFRKAAGSALLPIIVLTSRAFAFDIEKYLKEGVDLCLIKPVALKELGRIIDDFIHGAIDQHTRDTDVNKTQRESHSSTIAKVRTVVD